ncbi:hypothetical protein [Pseudaminobacter sp. NGMCC 1.201702]|uniref:hypothetical protein n=1 Tax=Pseudaminobacter sp. NGMCC 1.201702 TaxID=3391825 RepID=UPI0039F08952
MEIVYSRHLVADLGGRKYQNPRLFSGPIEGAATVFIDGDWPQIAAAYRAIGAEVLPISELGKARKSKAPKKGTDQ